jgi:glycosyltransferase involved in cell wall biosynthesis
MARTDIVFIMAGNMTLSRSLPGELGAIGRRGGGLDDYVKERDLGDYFIFLGHVSEPEQVLAACDVLAKPTRGHNPWGRDIIEAMAAGIPVLTVGSWNRFVEHGMTGIMHPEFDASAMAGDLAHLADQRCLLTELGTRARDRIMTLCNGPDRAADLAAAWRRAVTAHSLS